MSNILNLYVIFILSLCVMKLFVFFGGIGYRFGVSKRSRLIFENNYCDICISVG